MKLIRLQPNQIPAFWESIKFATKQVDALKIEEYEGYYIELLYSLLSTKAQCYVAINDNRKLIGLAITRIVESNITKRKQLCIQIIYAWEKTEKHIWDQGLAMMIESAKKEGCTNIVAVSSNPIIWQFAEYYKFGELERVYNLPIDKGGV